MHRRARPVPERDRHVRSCVPARLVVPREGRHLHQCRTAHQPRAQSDPADGRIRRLGSDHGALQRARLPDGLQASVRDHGRDRAPDADLRRRVLCASRRARQHSMAVQRCRTHGHADDAYRQVRARQGPVHGDRVRADRRTHHGALPARSDHRAHPLQYNVGAQTARTANTVWHEEDVLEIHPFDAESRGIRDGDLVALASRAGETACTRASRNGCSRAWSIRPSTT